MKQQQHTKFCKTFIQLISKKFQIDKDEGNTEEIDEALNAQLKGHKDISEFMEKYEVIRQTCKETNSPSNTKHPQKENQSPGGQTLSQY